MTAMKKTSTKPQLPSQNSSGFSKKTLVFLEKAGRQKNPNWLENHRADYETLLLAPLRHLTQTLKDSLGAEAPFYHFPIKGIGRLKRPANRVSERGTSLYRNWMTYSASRPHESRFEHNPNLFFLMNPEDKDDSVLVAGGLYMPSSRQTKAMRHALAENPALAAEFSRLFESKAFSTCFKGGFADEKISTRIPRGFDANHPRIEWIKLQAFYVWRSYSMKEFESPKFASLVERDWRQILRLNALLDLAIDNKALPLNFSKSSVSRRTSKTKSELDDRLEATKHDLPQHDF